MKSRHLQISDIAVFRQGLLSKEDSRETARHLLVCTDCRNLLPKPSAEEFWNRVITEKDQQLINRRSRLRFISEIISSIRHFRPAWQSAAFAGLFILVATGFSLLLLTNRSSQTDHDLLAKASNDEKTDPSAPFAEPPYPSTNGTGKVPVRSPEPPKLKPERNIADDRRRIGTDLRYSATRGSANDCLGQNTLETETTVQGANVRLRWTKVPKAAKYHLYVSDDEEILIDEFESKDATSYTLKKPLDPKKSYRWKVVITLENGETITADSQKLTGGSGKNSSNSSVSRRKSVTRCTEQQ